MIEAEAESEAEVARYGEYLLQELKWDTSRNFSSTKHMARLVGKKLDRKHSAVGTIIVSHTDPAGIPRYSYLGVDNFSIDSESDYDDQTQDTSLTQTTYAHALTPWLDVVNYSIPKGTIFSTKNGINFVAANTKTINTWTAQWSSIRNNNQSLQNFYASNGWDGYKYLTIPIVQGDLKEVNLGVSTGEGSQSFIVSTVDIEAADSYYTKQFCYVEVTDTDGNTTTWEEIQHLQTAINTDKVFEINILDNLTGTEIKFGDGICGAIPSENATITLHYLETKGAEGNVTELYSFQEEISNLDISSIQSTTTVYSNLAVGCQNMWPIIGGKDLETLDEYKENAETAYAKNYKILHTFTELIDNINLISPIPLLKIKTKDFYEITTINSTKVYVPVVGISGLSTGLEPLNTTEQALFNKILNEELNDQILSNKKIKYISPNIIELDTNMELELKNSIIDEQSYIENMQEYLQEHLGKASIDTMDYYAQADVPRLALNYSENIGSYQIVNLFTVKHSDLSYGTLIDKTKYYFTFTFTLPPVYVDTYSKEKYCNLSLADGNEIPFIFNININNNKTTILVKETEGIAENESYIYHIDNYFDSSTLQLLNVLDTSSTKYKYQTYQTLKIQNTFNRKELQDIANISLNTELTYGNPYIYFERDSNTLTMYLLLDADVIANQLGFNQESVSSSDILRIYSQLYNSLDNGNSKVTLSLEPSDKTVSCDWNTIIYYNNIDINITRNVKENTQD